MEYFRIVIPVEIKPNRNTHCQNLATKNLTNFLLLMSDYTKPCNHPPQWHTDGINNSWGWNVCDALYKDKQDLCILPIALEVLLHNPSQCWWCMMTHHFHNPNVSTEKYLTTQTFWQETVVHHTASHTNELLNVLAERSET